VKRTCTSCGKYKSISDFYVRRSVCKTCITKQNRIYYTENRYLLEIKRLEKITKKRNTLNITDKHPIRFILIKHKHSIGLSPIEIDTVLEFNNLLKGGGYFICNLDKYGVEEQIQKILFSASQLLIKFYKDNDIEIMKIN
jgi:hypothetical protein